MREIYQEIMSGHERVVDADLPDFFGSVEHEALINMIAEKVSDSMVIMNFMG